jgi:hypothetical protein
MSGPGDPRGPGEARDEDEDLRLELAKAHATIDSLNEQRATLDRKLEEVQAALREQQGEIGRLTVIASEAEAVRAERDALRQELSEAQATLAQRVAEQVQAQLTGVNAAHAQEIAALQAERDDLRRRIQELEEQGVGEAPEMTTSDLAGHFAEVLGSVAEQPTPPGRAYAATVTGLSVQAKGLLQAPTEPGGDVRLLTVGPGKIDPGQLSTVNLDLKLVPRLAPSPEPEG